MPIHEALDDPDAPTEKRRPACMAMQTGRARDLAILAQDP
jgi:hypothetical protein